MRVLKILCWLVAWSAWAWLGVGLHRELPRELGPPLAQLPITGPKPLAFVGDSNVIAVPDSLAYPHPTALSIYDAETGRLIRERDCPPGYDLAVEVFQSLRFGVWLKKFRNEPHAPGFQQGVERIDVLTNERRRLTTRDFAEARLHAEKPLLILVEPTDGGERIVVINIDSGEELCSVQVGKDHTINSTPFFLPDGSRFAAPITRKPGPPTLEIWTVANPSVMEASQPYVASNRPPSMSNNGRVVRKRQLEYHRFEVVDFHTGKEVFVSPDKPPSKAKGLGISGMGPTISDDGRIVFDFETSTFWDVDTGKVLWMAADYESAIPAMKDRLHVWEQWDKWWKATPAGAEKFMTTAFRNFETGAVEWRVRGRRMPQYLNGSGTLATDAFGNVYRWPPPVNAPLLAACQAVLALPIVMTWFVLRWRRKKLERRRQALAHSNEQD